MKTIIQISLILAALSTVGCATEGESKVGKAAKGFASGFVQGGLLGPLTSSYYKRISFSEFRGRNEILIGEGGTVRIINGIEIWKTGTPNRGYKIIGVINQQHLDNRSGASSRARSSLESDATNLAKQHGADAIIEWDNSKTVISYRTDTNVDGGSKGNFRIVKNGDYYTGNYRGNYSGTETSVTRANTKQEWFYLAVVYKNTDAITPPIVTNNRDNIVSSDKKNNAETEQDPSSDELYQETLDLLKRGGDPNELIHDLAFYGQTKALKLLATEGFNANFIDPEAGMAPLHWAVHKNRFETASYLIEQGADVNLATTYQKKFKANIKQAPLHFAAFNGDTGMIMLLLSKGANVNVLSPLVGTPLDIAIDRKQANAISVLKKHGAKTR